MKGLMVGLWNRLPNAIVLHVDILRRFYIWKKNKVIFIHVPKAAGYSVNVALYGRALGHFYAKDIRKLCPKSFESMFTFGVVRHPVDRLYSAYRFAKSGGTAVMGMKTPELYKIDAFSSFERFVHEWLVEQDLAEIDGVFRPQHLYLCDGDEVLVDDVFKLEKINLLEKKLSVVLDRNIILEHHNRSKMGATEFISDASLKIIEGLYKKDFEIFDYKLERKL